MVTFNMADGLEQKIDKLMVMMGRLVAKDEGQNRQFKPWVYQSNRGRGQTRWNYEQREFRRGLDQTTTGTIHIEEGQGMDKIIKVGQDMIWITEVIMETIWEVTKGMGDKIILEMDSGNTLETKAMKETGVGHMIGNLEVIIEGTIEELVMVDEGQVPEQVQIEIGLDVLSVESMIILQENAQQWNHTER